MSDVQTNKSLFILFIPYFSDATIYVGGLDEKVNESLLWELFVQGGPVVNVHMPKDRVTMMHQGKQLIVLLFRLTSSCFRLITQFVCHKLFGVKIEIKINNQIMNK